MAGTELRKNSLRVRFERGSPEPTDPEIFGFMKTRMMLKSEKLVSMYKDRSELSVIIKFKMEEDMRNTLRNLPNAVEFQYNKYESTTVKLSSANAVVKYVRLFNLPPEIADQEISAVMDKFGKIQRMVREKYAENTGFPIWNSVRGVYVEVKEDVEIPAMLQIRNLRARVFYEGLVNKCFVCGSAEHLKAECPQKKSVNERLQPSEQLPEHSSTQVPRLSSGQPTEHSSYSAMLKGENRWFRQQKANTEKEKGKENNMTKDLDNGKRKQGEGSGMVNLNLLFPRAPPLQKPTGEISGENMDVEPTTTNTDQPQFAERAELPTDEVGALNTMNLAEELMNPDKQAEVAFTKVTTKRGRRQVKLKGDKQRSDSEQSTTESEHQDNRTLVVPSFKEQISVALDRSTRNKTKQMKLSQLGECKTNDDASIDTDMQEVDNNPQQSIDLK